MLADARPDRASKAGNDTERAQEWISSKSFRARPRSPRVPGAVRDLLVLRLAAGLVRPVHRRSSTLWHGIGIITVLIAIAYLIWEIGRALKYRRDLGQVTPPMTSAGFAIALLVFTVITFLDWSDYPALAAVDRADLSRSSSPSSRSSAPRTRASRCRRCRRASLSAAAAGATAQQRRRLRLLPHLRPSRHRRPKRASPRAPGVTLALLAGERS